MRAVLLWIWIPLGVAMGLTRAWRLWAVDAVAYVRAVATGGALGGCAMLVLAVGLRPEVASAGLLLGPPLGGACAGVAVAVLVGWGRRWGGHLVRRPRRAAG